MFSVPLQPGTMPAAPRTPSPAARRMPVAPPRRYWHGSCTDGQSWGFAMRPQTDRQRLIRRALTALIPRAPYADFAAIYERARAKQLRGLAPSDAAFLAASAHLRHEHTDYDELLAEGYDRDSARHFVLDEMNERLTDWGATRFVDGSEDEDADGPEDEGDGARTG